MNNAGRFPIAERIVRKLRKRIARGDYPPHAYLPAERLLAREYGTSRTTVSKALSMLAREGLVVQSRGRGTRVLAPSERPASRPIALIYYTGARKDFWPESARILRGCQETFLRLGYPFRPCLSIEPPIESAAQKIGAEFAGVLMVEAFEREELALALQAQGIPLVVANLETDIDVSATCVDHERIMREAAETLIKLGHRRIAFLGRPPERSFHGKARTGYKAALENAGLPLDPKLIGVCNGPGGLAAYFVATEMLKLDDPPTAFVAARDVFAEGICRAAEEAGMTVGEDISVIGFDDISWPVEEPFLTTFREPCREMGAVAAQMLIDRIVHAHRPVEKRIIPAEFMLRRSAGPVRRHARKAMAPAPR